MAISKSQAKATAKYEKNNYFKTLVRFKKEDEERIRAAAGDSLNGFIVKCVLDALNKTEAPAQAPETVPEAPKPDKAKYLPLTPKNIEKIDFALLTSYPPYQGEVFDKFGLEGFNKLIELAKEKQTNKQLAPSPES